MSECEEITNDAGRFRVALVPDSDGENPRENHTFGTLVVTFPQHVTPAEGEHARRIIDAIDGREHRFAVLARWLRIFHGATVVLPIYNAGHLSSPLLSPGSGAAEEDADPGNFIGLVYATHDDTDATWLQEEVRDYNAWASGEMMAWIVERLDVDYDGCDGLCTYGCGAGPWKTMESVWGYYSEDHARSEAVEALTTIAAQAQTDHVDALHAQALAESEIRELAASEQ